VLFRSPSSAELIDNASRAIDAALREAKTVKEVSAQTGQFSSFPVYGKDQQVTAWRVRAELALESSDFKALSALAGKLGARLAIASMNYSLSAASRKAAEKRLIGEAIAAFRDKAQAAAQAFGYAKFRIRDVSVNSGGSVQPRPLARAFSAMAGADAAPMPIEAGRATVTVAVSGSVLMEK
jgi:predicted secreted protein